VSVSLNPFGSEKFQEEIKMLDNLVESKNNSANQARRGGYLFTTAVLVFSLFASGILWSLFAKDLNMGSDNMELSSMVAPVPVPAEEPPAPEPIVKEIKQNTTAKTEDNTIIRRENLASTDEPIAPKDISVKPNTNLSRPKNAEFKIGTEDITPSNGSGVRENTGRTTGGIGEPTGIKNQVAKVDDSEKDAPPPIKKKEEPKEDIKPKVPPTISKGVINGTALNLPRPAYPAAAKAIRVSGDVNVQVTIDEQGNVISASAVSGHALLKQVSEQAARSAKFRPTLLSGQPVKVTGIIVYKFSAQ
jgi:protein TonB